MPLRNFGAEAAVLFDSTSRPSRRLVLRNNKSIRDESNEHARKRANKEASSSDVQSFRVAVRYHDVLKRSLKRSNLSHILFTRRRFLNASGCMCALGLVRCTCTGDYCCTCIVVGAKLIIILLPRLVEALSRLIRPPRRKPLPPGDLLPLVAT